MVKSCCAYGCTERFVSGSAISFHSFPKNAVLKRRWEVALRRENFTPSNYSTVCSKHFKEECFNREKFGGRWLKLDAVPSIFNFPDVEAVSPEESKLPLLGDHMEIADDNTNTESSKTNDATDPPETVDNMEPVEALRFYIRKVLGAIEASTKSKKLGRKRPAPPPRTLKMHLPPDAQQVLVFIIAGNSVSGGRDSEHAEGSTGEARVRIVEQQGENSTGTVLVIDQWGGTKPYDDDIFTSENPGERIETLVVDVSEQLGTLPTATGAPCSDRKVFFSEGKSKRDGSANVDSSRDGVSLTRASVKRVSRSTKRPKKRLRLGNSPLICDVCGMEFELKSALDVHTCQKEEEKNYFICKFCDKTYDDQNEFWKHYRSHVKSNRDCPLHTTSTHEIVDDESNCATLTWECADCEAEFQRRDELRLHRRESHPLKHNCQICKVKFSSKEELAGHHDLVHLIKVAEVKQHNHKCVDCLQIFGTSEILQEHCKETKHVSHVQCTVCEEKFTSRTELRKHKRVSHEMRYACSKCTEIFSTKRERLKHRETVHPMIVECQECELKFTNRIALDEHRREAHLHMCVFCEKMFATELELNTHQALHLENPSSATKKEAKENNEKVDIKDETKIMCKTCNRSFSSELAFRKHNVISHGERLFACSTCSVVMQSRKELIKHKESHKEKHECEQCGRQYLHKRDLLRHIPTHSEERPHPCVTCGFRFHTAERLRKHQAIHEEKRYLCDLCPMKFTDNEHLRRHLKSHAYKQRQRVSSLIFRCLMCPETFDSPTRLQQHYNQEHPVAEYRCVDCNILVASFDLLKIHFREQHKGKVIHCCRICGDAFDKKQKFLTHRNRTHKVPRQQHVIVYTNTTCSACQITFMSNEDYASHLTDENEKCKEAAAASNKEPAPKLYKCLPCNEMFPTSAHLATHSGIHGTKFPTACDICGMPLADSSKITEHLAQHLASGTWSCTKCGKSLSSWQSLRVHMGEHCVASPLTCNICGKTFNSRNALESHTNVHTGNSPFRCNRCPAAFKQPIQLKAHLLSHDGRKMYECAECNKTFAARSSLVAHLGNHVNGQLGCPAPTFDCTVCGKVFDHKANLSNHLRTHSGEKGQLKKQFSCEVCKRTFTTLAHLIVHERSHDDADASLTSVCPVCQKKFKTVKALGLHMRIHTSESPMCPICSKGFTIQRSLEEHMELHDEQGIDIKCPSCSATFRSQHSFQKHTAQCCSVYNNQICRQCGLGYADLKNYEGHIKVCNHKQNRRTTENLYTLQPPTVVLPATDAVHHQHDHLSDRESAVAAAEGQSTIIITDDSNFVENTFQAIVEESVVNDSQEGATDLEQLIEGQAPTELILDGPQGKVRVQFIYETTA